MIPREKTSEELVDLFFPKLDLEDDQEMCTFWLIVGPMGTGKTALVTKLCNTYISKRSAIRERHFQQVWPNH